MEKKKRKQKLKVYGGYYFRGNGYRIIIATTSKKRVAEIIPDMTLRYIQDYWSETGNEEDIAQAMTKPHTPFYVTAKDQFRKDKQWTEGVPD